MKTVEATTQAQLDKAIKNRKPGDIIVCLGGTRYQPLVAWESSHVVAWGSSHVVARGSSHVVARESSHVVARESSHVVARESSHVEAWGSSHVEAWESSHVVAWESSHVVAWESSHVVAWGSSHVEAWGSSHVEAWGSSHVVATKYVSVHKHPGHSKKINGGVVIEVPDVNEFGPKDWCDYYGVKITRGTALLYKALDDDLSTPQARTQGIIYAPGVKVVAPDWDAVQECGNGLHACPSPVIAEGYNSSATRYVQVKVKVAEMVTLGNKVKVPGLAVVCEVDRNGEPIAETKAA